LSQSRNIGLLAAQGDIVAFIDDDAVPSFHWLAQLARLFHDPLLDATGGIVYGVHPRQPSIQYHVGMVSSLAEQVDVRRSRLDPLAPSGEGRMWVERMMGTNMAFRRRALLDVGGFDEFYAYIAEEADIAFRLVSAGKRVHPVNEAAVYHIPASSRNRIVFTYTGKWWWLETRSKVYYSLKNGPASGDSWRSIWLRCLRLGYRHCLNYMQLWWKHELTLLQVLNMTWFEFRGMLEGIVSGVFRAPRLLSKALIETAMQSQHSIVRFQNTQSATQPAVDPVSGYRPSISLPDEPLRLCLLSHTYPPEQFDGVGRLTNLMARGLFELGNTVHVITQGETERVAFYDGAFVHQMPYRLERYERYRNMGRIYSLLNHSHALHDQIRRLRMNDGIQIVDSPLWLFEGLVTAVSDLLPVVVRLVTAQRQVADIHREQGKDVRLIGEMEQLLIECAAHVLPNTRATLEAVIKTYGVKLDENRYTIVPYGIVPAQEQDVRPFDLKRRPDELTVLFVGRLEKRKGILDLFDAIPQVLSRVPHARFVIVGGDNSFWDGFKQRTGMDYPAYFSERHKRSSSRVTFKGLVRDNELASLYQTCDLFVAPSLYESFGLIYLEAMNYAKPVIGCRAGGIPEVVDAGVTGLLVEPEAPSALAEAMITLLSSPVKLHDMGLAGRQQILEKFTYLQMARNFERVYRAVIHAFKPAATDNDLARSDP
jgi:hypothetical protein